MKRRLFAMALTIALVLSLLPAAVASGEETGSAMYLGADVISGYDGNYDYVYYGKHNSDPVLWRVLDDSTNVGGDGLFLLSEYALDNGSVYFDENSPYSNVWQSSDAQGWSTNFYSNAFSTLEQSAIIATRKSDEQYTSDEYGVNFSAVSNILNDEKVFFLSAKEAETPGYGFVAGSTGNTSRVAKTGKTGGAAYWWVRSPNADGSDFAGGVYTSGNVGYTYVYNYFAARPAFNFDLESVIFTSAAAGGKSGAAGAALTRLDDDAISEYKFTLKDETRNLAIGEIDRENDTLTVAYTGATTGADEYISAVIVDDKDTIIYYGALANTTAANGTVTITLPVDFADGDTLYVFSEQKNGDYYTDYASALQEVEVPEEDETPPPGDGVTKYENVLSVNIKAVEEDEEAEIEDLSLDISPLGGIVVDSLTQLEVGESYDIEIWAEDMTNVWDLAIPLVFNKNKIEVTAVTFNSSVTDFEQTGINGALSKYVPGSSDYDVDDVNTAGMLALYMLAADDAADISGKVKLWTITVTAIAPTLYATPATSEDIITVGDSNDYPGPGMLSYGVLGHEGSDATDPEGIFTADLDFEGLEIVAPAAIHIAEYLSEEPFEETEGQDGFCIPLTAAVGWEDTDISGVTPNPATMTWELKNVVGEGPTPVIDIDTGIITVKNDFEGTFVAVATANYNNNFGSNRDESPDYPVDEILVTITANDIIIGYYVKVEITEPADGTQMDNDGTSINFTAAVTWDDVKNEFVKDGVPEDNDVIWTIVESSGTYTYDSDEESGFETTGVLEVPTLIKYIGTIKVRATAVKKNPDGEHPYDEIVVAFTEDGIEIGVNSVSFTGVVKLAKKVRNNIALFGFTARNDYDVGIEVSIIGVEEDNDEVTIVSTVTDASGSFTLEVPAAVELYQNSVYESFKLVAVRIGNDNGLRNEAYLAAEVELAFSEAYTWEDGPVDLFALNSNAPIWLFPGDYDYNDTITTADYSEIKAKVGLISGESSYNTKYDVNEYTGIDGGDLASVKSGAGREKGNDNYNPATFNVN